MLKRSLNQLPKEVIELIYMYLPLEDMQNLKRFSKNTFIIFETKSRSEFSQKFWDYDIMKGILKKNYKRSIFLSRKFHILSPFSILKIPNLYDKKKEYPIKNLEAKGLPIYINARKCDLKSIIMRFSLSKNYLLVDIKVSNLIIQTFKINYQDFFKSESFEDQDKLISVKYKDLVYFIYYQFFKIK